MLTTDDVQIFFEKMRTAYGAQWKHGPAAAKHWRNEMSAFSSADLDAAASKAMTAYVNHPPTLPQFMQLLRKTDSRQSTYVEPPKRPLAVKKINRMLFKVIQEVGGVDKRTMKVLDETKSALLEELGDEAPGEEFIDDGLAQFRAIAAKWLDREKRAQETQNAAQRLLRTGRAA